MFKEIKEDFNYPRMEERILQFWEKSNVFHKSIRIRDGAPDFVFYEGPPTANGKPGIHHVISRTIKDLVVETVAKTGENVRVSRFSRFEVGVVPADNPE